MENHSVSQPQVPVVKAEEQDIVTKHELPSEFAVDVSIEPNHECEIIEVKYDGQEVYKE